VPNQQNVIQYALDMNQLLSVFLGIILFYIFVG